MTRRAKYAAGGLVAFVFVGLFAGFEYSEYLSESSVMARNIGIAEQPWPEVCSAPEGAGKPHNPAAIADCLAGVERYRKTGSRFAPAAIDRESGL